jgi:hypothetical protein
MKKLLGLLLLLATAAHAQTATAPFVYQCPTATSGTLFGSTFMPCTPAATAVAPTSTLIVAAQIAAKSYVSEWALASSLQPTDQVYTDEPNPTTPSSNWWPVSSITFAGSPPPPVSGAELTIKWQAPTANANGTTPVTPLSGYSVCQGTSATSMPNCVTVGPTVLSYTATALAPGTYYFEVIANGADGLSSVPSSVVSGTITAPPPPNPTPGQPISVTITVTLTATAP